MLPARWSWSRWSGYVAGVGDEEAGKSRRCLLLEVRRGRRRGLDHNLLLASPPPGPRPSTAGSTWVDLVRPVAARRSPSPSGDGAVVEVRWAIVQAPVQVPEAPGPSGRSPASLGSSAPWRGRGPGPLGHRSDRSRWSGRCCRCWADQEAATDDVLDCRDDGAVEDFDHRDPGRLGGGTVAADGGLDRVDLGCWVAVSRSAVAGVGHRSVVEVGLGHCVGAGARPDSARGPVGWLLEELAMSGSW